MLEKYFGRINTLDRIRSLWIGEAVERYAAWLSEQRYTSRTVYRRLPIVVSFGQFAREHGASRWEDLPTHVNAFVESWLKTRTPKRKCRLKEMADIALNAVEQMLRIIVPGFVSPRISRKPENPFHEQAPGFFEHLRYERGLRESTLRLYSQYLYMFAAYLQRIKLTDLAQLSAPVLSAFLTQYATRGVARTRLEGICGVLRSLLRYLCRERVLRRDLSTTIEYPQKFRLSGIPRSITWEDARRTLETIDRRTPVGRRDYAILLLLVTYGLRGQEIVSLTLDDIDWRNQRLRVPQRKAGHSTTFPLSPAVGQAIIEYLKGGRPETADRRLFLPVLAPLRPLTHASVSARAAYYLRKAGIRVIRPGSHTLRHTCVQRLVDADFPLKVIGDYIGHRSPSSTQIYSKVAIEALRSVALGDGEAVL